MARPRARRRIPRGLAARVVACACAAGTENPASGAAFEVVPLLGTPHAFLRDGLERSASHDRFTARALLNFVPADLGRPAQDLEVSYRPEELRSLIAQVVEQRRPVASANTAKI
jgi:two-component system, chemotaxis family, CheB/CheR fusion protein